MACGRHTRKSAGYYSLPDCAAKGSASGASFAPPVKSNHLVEEARLLGPGFSRGQAVVLFSATKIRRHLYRIIHPTWAKDWTTTLRPRPAGRHSLIRQSRSVGSKSMQTSRCAPSRSPAQALDRTKKEALLRGSLSDLRRAQPVWTDIPFRSWAGLSCKVLVKLLAASVERRAWVKYRVHPSLA